MGDFLAALDWHEIFIQFLGFVSFAIFMIAYQVQDPKKTQLIFAPGTFVYGLQYFLLGSLGGAIVMFASSVRDISAYFLSGKILKILTIVHLFFIWSVAFVFNGEWLEYAAVLGASISTLAILFRDHYYKYRGMLALRQSLWLVFNGWIGSWGGVLHLAFTLLSNLVGVLRYSRSQTKGKTV